MEKLSRPLLKLALLVTVIGALMVPLSACKTGSAPDSGTGGGPVPVPIVAGIVDCAAPSLWQTLSFATLVPIVEHAVAQHDGYSALEDLLRTYSEAEVSCVAAYLNDQGSKQAIDAPGNAVVKNRVAVTAMWLQREDAKGVRLVNFAGSAN